MKRVFRIVSLLLAASLALAASPALAVSDIAINSKNFPDKGMRKALQAKYDLDGDKIISISEQKQLFPGLDLTECDISEATGIGLFPYIEALDLGWNSIKKLDLRGNPNLEYITIDHNGLTSVNLSNSTDLIDFSAPENKLTSLDLSGCPKLEVLYVPDNKLTSIDVTNNPLLEQLVISNSGMKLNFLDLSHNPKLVRLETQGCSIKGIDIADCPELLKITRNKTFYQDDKNSVSFGVTEIIIDKNTILTNNGDPIYIPEMYPFLEGWSLAMFPEEFDGYCPAVVKKESKIYSDKSLKHSIGIIPGSTAVNVTPYTDSSSCKISNYGGQTCYIASSALWGINTVDPNWAYLTLDKTVKGYQRPDPLSASVVLEAKTRIAVVKENNGWYLIRAVKGDNDSYFFVPEI